MLRLIIQALKQKLASPVFLAKVAILLVPVVLFAWIFNEHYFITKTLHFRFRPDHPKGSIQIANRSDLVASFSEVQSLEWRLNDDSLRFNVKIPRGFETATVSLQLENDSQPYITLVAQAPAPASLRPLIVDNEFLNTLPWPSVSDGSLTLWQRESRSETATVNGSTVTTEVPNRQYASVEQFNADPPSLNTVGAMNINLDAFVRVPGYEPAREPITIAHSIRGSHTVVLYAQDETIDISFNLVDLNRSSGKDDLEYRLTYEGETFLKGTVPDDGITVARDWRTQDVPVHISYPNAAPGIYKLELTTSDDILLRNLTSQQHYVSFLDHVFLADGPFYEAGAPFTPVALSVARGRVVLETAHEEGTQTVTVGTKNVAIMDPKVTETTTAKSDVTAVRIPKGDLYLTAKDIVIEPALRVLAGTPVQLSYESAPDVEDLDYIVAPYKPRETYGTVSITKEYKSSELLVKSKMITFSLRAPGIIQTRNVLKVKGIDVVLTRGPLPWSKLSEKLLQPFRELLP